VVVANVVAVGIQMVVVTVIGVWVVVAIVVKAGSGGDRSLTSVIGHSHQNWWWGGRRRFVIVIMLG